LEKVGGPALKGTNPQRRRAFRMKGMVCVLPLCLAAGADRGSLASRTERRTA